MSLIDALLGDKGLVVKFKADLTDLQAGIARAKTDLIGWRDETNANTQGMASWGAAITANVAPVLALGAAVYGMQQKYGALASEITDMSTSTGLSIDKIQQLQYAAVLSNTAFSNVAMGVNTLTLAISKAGDVSSEAGKAFAEIGVSTNGRSVDQVFEDTTTALVGMENTTRRNEIAMTLYGRSWKEMLPFMEDYTKNKEKIQSSPTFSKQDLQDLKDAKIAWDDLGNSVTIYSGKALVEVQKGTSFLLTMDAAYRKLAVGDVGGFLDAAAEERNRQIMAEHDKLTNLIATNSGPQKAWSPAGAPATDPFSGLTAQDAEIKNLKDYTIPDLEAKYKELATSGTASMSEIAAASMDVINAKQELIDLTTEETDAEKERISALVSAWKEYEDEIKNVADEKKDLYNLEHDYSEDIMAAGRDVGSMRSINTNFVRQRRSITGNLDTDVSDAVSAATSYNAIKGGAALETVKGTPQYEQAQAKKGLAGITITGPIYLNGDKSFETYLSSQLLRNGVSP